MKSFIVLLTVASFAMIQAGDIKCPKVTINNFTDCY